MKIKVYERAAEVKDTVILRLRDDGDNEIVVVAVNSNGDELNDGELIRFNEDGTIHRMAGIDRDLGFKLSDDRRIELDE